MHSNITNYSEIMAGQHKAEHKLVISGTEYLSDDIISFTSTGALFDSFGIGNAVSRSLKAVVIPKGSIPSIASIDLYMRVSNGSLESSWVPKGKFFIDTRSTDDEGFMTITAYDSMLKANAVFMEQGTFAETTALAVLTSIATAMDVSVDSATSTLMQTDPVTISSIPAIGTSGTTMREMLSHIGILYGGNFAMTDDGTLKLFSLSNSASVDTDLGVLMESLSVSPAFEKIRKVRLTYGDTYYEASQCEFSCPASAIGTMASGLPYVLLSSLTALTSKAAPEAGDYIKITDSSDTYYKVTVVYPGVTATLEASDTPGRLITAETFYASASNAVRVLGKLYGFIYQPYAADGAYLEIAAELGDSVKLNNTSSVIYSFTRNHDCDASASLSAKSDEEIDHEYPYVDGQTQKIKSEVNQLKSMVETQLKVLPGEIMGSVSKGYAAQFSESSAVTYDVGSFVIYEKKYYVCIGQTTGGTWDSSKWSETSAVDMSQTLIDQTADEIKAEVYGTYSEKWASGTKYYIGDIICLASSNKFYEALLTHTADSTNMPPNTTYWDEVDAPTGESFINLGIRGITIQNTGTTPSGSNQASIKLTKDNIDIAAGTITMSNVTVDSIAANKITAGTLNSDVIYSGTISADNISAGELDADKVTLKGLFSVTDKNDNDAGYIGGFKFGNNTFMYMKSPSGEASVAVADFDLDPNVAVVGINADQIQLQAPIILDSDSYGSSLPSSGTTGQLFFLI